MCGLGRLYSKQNVIEHLLESKMPESCAHIKSLKDVKDLNLTANPAYEKNHDDRSAEFICALIGLEMSGQFRFAALWSCGCVFSERALKEIKDKNCSSVSIVIQSCLRKFVYNVNYCFFFAVPHSILGTRCRDFERYRRGYGSDANPYGSQSSAFEG